MTGLHHAALVEVLKNHILRRGAAIMRAAMLLETVWYGVPFGPGNWWPKMCAGESGAALVEINSCQQVLNLTRHAEKITKCALILFLVQGKFPTCAELCYEVINR